MNLQQNNFSFSNQPSSRRSNHPKVSGQSTSKSIRLDSTRQEQPISSKGSYRRLHSRQLKQLSEDPAYQQAQLHKQQLKAAIRIQRYWRFHLLMRRKVQDDFLRKLSLENQSLERQLRNEEIKEQLMTRELDEINSTREQAIKELLGPSKLAAIEFAHKLVVHSVGRSSHLQNVRLAASYQQRELQTNLAQYRQAKQRLAHLTTQRRQKQERQRQLIAKAASLSQQLVMQNALKSKLQCECDELQVQNSRLRCQ